MRDLIFAFGIPVLTLLTLLQVYRKIQMSDRAMNEFQFFWLFTIMHGLVIIAGLSWAIFFPPKDVRFLGISLAIALLLPSLAIAYIRRKRQEDMLPEEMQNQRVEEMRFFWFKWWLLEDFMLSKSYVGVSVLSFLTILIIVLLYRADPDSINVALPKKDTNPDCLAKYVQFAKDHHIDAETYIEGEKNKEYDCEQASVVRKK